MPACGLSAAFRPECPACGLSDDALSGGVAGLAAPGRGGYSFFHLSTRRAGEEATGREWLWIVPAMVLAASYSYICWYHATWNPISTIVHEGGKLTLWETTLYASHFLGHVPVLVVLALWLTGAWTSVSGPDAWPGPWPAAVRLVLFLLVSIVLSLGLFGGKDTLDFVLQRKQSEAVYGEGGSWNLHLPSTMLLFFLIPAFVSTTRRMAGLPRRDGNATGWFVAGWLLVVSVTIAVNGSFAATVARVWGSPRYLAHSVRELLTSPLILFPPALYLLVRQSEETRSSGSVEGLSRWEIGSLAIFMAGAMVQASVAFMSGVSNLAQKPSFAHGGSLSIPYLLSVHYFEHALDMVFLALVCGLLARFSRTGFPKNRQIRQTKTAPSQAASGRGPRPAENPPKPPKTDCKRERS